MARGGKSANGVTALAIDMKLFQQEMDPDLHKCLTQQRLLPSTAKLEADQSNTTEEDFIGILEKVTGVKKDIAAIHSIGSGKFCITYDTLLKMLAIYTRLRCNIPVVLMGECGCGKTALLNYMTGYLDIPLISADIHGGTTEADIVAKIEEAEAMDREVWVFLDEINTCAEMGLLTEIIVRRRCRGRRISENISIVAALNPYRRKNPAMMEESGLVFQLHSGGGEVTPDPMADLVYKVHPIPGTLLEYCFDYGSLTDATEMLYINAMITRCLPSANNSACQLFAEMMSGAQSCLREIYGETSVVSLRDVQRAINLLAWFTKTGNNADLRAQKAEFEESFTSDDATHKGVADGAAVNGPFIPWLLKHDGVTREKALGVCLSGRKGAPAAGSMEDYIAFLQSTIDRHFDVHKCARYIQTVQAVYPKWAGIVRKLSTDFKRVIGYNSVTIEVEVTAATVQQGGPANGQVCELMVSQSADGATKAAETTLSFEWEQETETVQAAREKTTSKTFTVQLSHPFAKIEVKSGCDTGTVSVRGLVGEENENIRVENPNGTISTRPMVLALAHVYYYRLNEEDQRAMLLAQIAEAARAGFSKYVEDQHHMVDTLKGDPRKEFETGLAILNPITAQVDELQGEGVMARMIDVEQDVYIDNMIIEEGIARNKALKENLFVVITCVLNRIPAMVVGKPGTSKTLCLQLIQENLRGTASKNDYWKAYPTISLFPYQCSPLSTAAQIQKQYDSAAKAQEVAGNASVTVLLLDEIGLAEFSPDMPLKVLHAMLMSKTVAIVGVSNWMLDPAKMNRAVCLRRPDPPKYDLKRTGMDIVGVQTSEKSRLMESGLAEAYHQAYTKQRKWGRDYLGMRDYYSLLKFLGRELRKPGTEFNKAMLERALCRNFGGKKNVMDGVLEMFSQKCKMPEKMTTRTVVGMISENLADAHSRHLMVLTQNSAAIPILKALGLVDFERAELLVGSEFVEDASELQLIQQLNAVKRAMAEGKTLILINHDNMYEALYDVLNQRYVKQTSKNGTELRMLRVAVGMRSALCPVHDDFKLICVVEDEHAYEKLDLPLLNRFEKQRLVPESVLTGGQLELVESMLAWVESCMREVPELKKDEAFAGYDDTATLATLVLSLDLKDASPASQEVAKKKLVRACTPLAMIKARPLRMYKDEYFESQSSFVSYCKSRLISTEAGSKSKLLDIGGSVAVTLTKSPETHIVPALADFRQSPEFSGTPIDSCVLYEYKSEDRFRSMLKEFFSPESAPGPAVKVVQCDPVHVSYSHVRHAVRIVEDEARQRANFAWADLNDKSVMDKFSSSEDPDVIKALEQGFVPAFPRHVVFVMHLPPGMRSRKRKFPLDLLLAKSVWFLDDLRPSVAGGMSAEDMLFKSIYTLSKEVTPAGHFKLDLWAKVQDLHRASLQRLRVPHPGREIDLEKEYHLYPHRMLTMRTLMANDRFREEVMGLMQKVLEKEEFQAEPPLQERIALEPGRVAGSLRECFTQAIDEIVVQLFARVLAKMERNFGLSILADAINHGHAAAESLWWMMTDATGQCLEDLLPQHVLDGLRIEVLNDGPQVFIARYPSSFAMVNFFEEGQLKETLTTSQRAGISVDREAATIMVKKLMAVHELTFTKEVSQAVVEFGKEDAQRNYLGDYITCKCPTFVGVTEDEQLDIYASLLESWMPNSLQLLGAIHVGTWLNEKRVFFYCHLVGAAEQFNLKRLKQELLTKIAPPKSEDKGIFDCDKRVLLTLMNMIQEAQAKLPDEATWRFWINVTNTFEAYVDGLMSMPEPDNKAELITVQKWRNLATQQWSGIKLMSLFLEEIAIAIVQQDKDVGRRKSRVEAVAAQIAGFRKLVPSCKPEKFDFLKSLCKWAGAFCAELKLNRAFSGAITASLLRRYFLEMVFVQGAAQPEKEVLDFAMDIVKGGVGADVLPPEVLQELSLRRALLFHLFESTHSNMTTNTRKLVLRSLTRYDWTKVPSREVGDFGGLQLYSQLREYQIAHGMKEKVAFDRSVGDAKRCIELAIKLSTDGSIVKVGRDKLLPAIDDWTQTRITVMEYAECVKNTMDAQSYAVNTRHLAAVVHQMMSVDAGAEGGLHPWQLLFLRTFYASGGIGMLKELLENRHEAVPWLMLPEDTGAASAVVLEERVALPFNPFGLMVHLQGLALGEFGLKQVNFAFERALSASRPELVIQNFTQDVTDEMLGQRKFFSMVIPSCLSKVYQKYMNEDPKKTYERAVILDKHIEAKVPALLHACPVARDMLSAILLNFPQCSDRFPAVAKMFKATGESMSAQLLKVQFATDLFATAYANKDCYFWRLLESPDQLAGDLVPTMPANEMAMIVKAGLRDVTRWYKCANGHAFAVGNCGMMMQVAKCHCGAPIGGTNHKKLDSVQDANIGDMAADDAPGYMKDFVTADSKTRGDLYRSGLSAFGVRVLSLCMHATLALSCALGYTSKVAKLIGFSKEEDCAAHVMKVFELDWDACKKSAELNNTELGVLLSGVLSHAQENAAQVLPPMVGRTFTNAKAREAWEGVFMRACVSPLVTGGNVKQNIQQRKERFGQYVDTVDQKSMVVKMTGSDLWNEIEQATVWDCRTAGTCKAAGVCACEPPHFERLMLRFSQPITFDYFMRQFQMNTDNVTTYPTLALITRISDGDLPLIKHMPAMLAWHAVLFEAFQNGIDRKGAEKWTNRMVIEQKVSKEKQHEAWKIFEAYCEGFNAVFPSTEKEFYRKWDRRAGVGEGCWNKNPYVDKDWKKNGSPGPISLTLLCEEDGEEMSTLGMTADTSVAFSLPNNANDGGPGHCSIRLIEKLYQAHNEVILEYAKTLPPDSNHPAKNEQTPLIDYREPLATLRSRSVEYSEEADLKPLVLLYAQQELGYSGGAELKFDFAKIEQELANKLLKGKSPIKVMIRQFDYDGELSKGGALSVLSQSIDQIELGDEERESIAAEIDVEHRARALLNFLDQVIEFIASVAEHNVKQGGRNTTASPDMRLKEYAMQVMQEDEEYVDKISSVTINDCVCLKHLQSLFRLLEENVNGSFFSRVYVDFRRQLTVPQKEALQRAQTRLEVDLILPIIRQFIIDQLCSEKCGIGPSTDLTATLDYLDLNDDDYLSDLPSYNDNFPRGVLTIANTLAVYQLLSGGDSGIVNEGEVADPGGAGPA